MSSEITGIGEIFSEKIKHSNISGRVESCRPIGVFDSGVGGLTVLSCIMRLLPNEDIIYIGDTARVPYGGREDKEIIDINRQFLDYFTKQEVKMVIMACGTSSSIAYPVLKNKYKIPIVALITPGSKMALNSTKNFKIGLIATVGTINSCAYQKKIYELNKEALVFAEPCPLFVPLIEGGFLETEETKKIAREYLKPILEAGADSIILGCTHYPHLTKVIHEIAGQNIILVDPAEGAVAEAREILAKNGILNQKNHKAHYQYFVTGSPTHFEELGSKLLGKNIAGVKQIQL